MQKEDCGLKLKVFGEDLSWWFASQAILCFVRAKKPVKMPGYHYVDRKLDVTNHNKDYTSVEQCEISIARKPVVAWRFFRVKSRQKYAVAYWNVEFDFSLEK